MSVLMKANDTRKLHVDRKVHIVFHRRNVHTYLKSRYADKAEYTYLGIAPSGMSGMSRIMMRLIFGADTIRHVAMEIEIELVLLSRIRGKAPPASSLHTAMMFTSLPTSRQHTLSFYPQPLSQNQGNIPL